MKTEDILIFLVFSFHLWMSTWVIRLFLEERYKKWSAILFAVVPIVYIFPGCLLSLWSLADFNLLRCIVSQVGMTVTIFLLYQGKALIKFFVYFIILAVMMITEIVTNSFMAYIFFVMGHGSDGISVQQYICSQLLYTLLFACACGMIVFVGRRMKFRLTLAEMKLFFLFPASQAIMAIIFFIIMMRVSSQVTLLIIIVTLLVSAIADVGLYKAVVQMAQKRTIEERARQLEQQLELQLEHYEELSLFQDNLAGLRHDVGNQLQVIRTLLEQKDYAEAEKLSDQLQGEIKNLHRASYCHHKVVNALIYSKGKKCEDQGIRFTVEMSLGDNISIDKMDLCRIYSNLLDNALEACQQLLAEGRAYIDLRTWTNGDYLMIKCRNSYDGILKRDEKGQLLSTKNEQRGRGMKILEDITAKYQGGLNLNIEQNIFEAAVTLKV